MILVVSVSHRHSCSLVSGCSACFF